MAIFWLKIGAAALKAVCAALLLYWKESSDLGKQWTPAIRGSNQADQTWISEKILDAIIEEARNRKFQRELTAVGVRNRKYQGEQTAVGAKNQFHHARLAHTEIGQITGTGSGSKSGERYLSLLLRRGVMMLGHRVKSSFFFFFVSRLFFLLFSFFFFFFFVQQKVQVDSVSVFFNIIFSCTTPAS
jgi:hypothetical protein